VLETEGSTYVGAGAAAWFGPDAHVGWLSGGCLEADVMRRAADAAHSGVPQWMELDTRDDADLLGGSTAGCRGRLRLVLLPLAASRAAAPLFDAWFAQPGTLQATVERGGAVTWRRGADAVRIDLAGPPCPWPAGAAEWVVRFDPLPRIAIFGAGPESETLLPLLRTLGFRTLLVERRRRWSACAALADRSLEMAPEEALRDTEVAAAQAALVMHHHFEFDREALAALGATPPDFVGLLGPRRRREDLFRLLPAAACAALEPRLRSPVGMHLGGQGAEAIALSIAAQLQAWRHGR
jgi:xanthine dehydrogenase accessory factor